MTTRDLRSRLRAQGFADDHVEVIATTVDEWLAVMPDGVDAIDQIVGYAVPHQANDNRSDHADHD